MKTFFTFVLLFAFLVLGSWFFVPFVHASSARAYQDYLYQFDVYRQVYNEFGIAKNEYLKFNTLAAQQTAITKTRDMLSQRDQLIRAYLLMLNEKITETPELTPSETNLYRTLITNEVSFLDSQSQFVQSIQTLQDAETASQQLEQHYTILQISMDQTILGITLAKIRGLGDEFSNQMVVAKALIDQAKPELPLERQTIIDRWFSQISNKQTLFRSKHDTVAQAITSLKSSNAQDLSIKFDKIQEQIMDAESELKEGNSYMRELINAMRYKDSYGT